MSDDDKPMLTLEKGESVYSFAIFLPPLIQKKHGSFYNYDMCLGIILLLLNVAMQVGLTFVVGQGVLVEGNEWRQTLVGIEPEDQMEQGQVAKDADQAVSFLDRSGFSIWQTDPDPVDHFLHEVEMEVGLKKRTNHDEELAEIEELERRLEEEDSDVQQYKFKKEKASRGQQALLARATTPETTGPTMADTVSLVAAGKPPPGTKQSSEKGGSSTFCNMKNATYTCLPPSVKYAAQWEKLDTNGDGVWTRAEAELDAAGFEKKFKAKAFMVFRAISVGLVDRQVMDKNLWVSPEVAQMEAIPKAYFDYWMGDAALCSYADPGMCPSLLARGYFTEALRPAYDSLLLKDIADIDGALDYCNFMLKPGGGCEQSLPQIFQLYKAHRHQQCGDGIFYPGGLFKNPYQPTDRVYIIANSYSNMAKYLKADSLVYKCFLFLVLLLWLLALTGELQEMIKLAEFTYSFPNAGRDDGGLKVEEDEEGNVTYTITGISSDHRSVIGLTCLLRTVVVIYLGIVGCIFLVLETGYMDLLMNAVALGFILEIDELLFGAIARMATIEQLEALNDLKFPTNLPTEGCAGWMLVKDFWGIVLFPIIAYLLILCHSLFTTKPVLDALNCGCYQVGSQCADAQYYNLEWWNFYWSETLPNAMKKIAEYRAGGGF